MLKRNIYIRPIIPEDIGEIYQWVNNTQVSRFNGIPFRFCPLQEVKNEYLRVFQDKDKEFILTYVDDTLKNLGLMEYRYKKPILTGPEITIRAGAIDDEKILDKTFQALVSLFEYIFMEIGYERLSLPLAGKLVNLEERLKGIGFVREAIIREERFMGGKHIHTLRMGLMKEEYKAGGV